MILEQKRALATNCASKAQQMLALESNESTIQAPLPRGVPIPSLLRQTVHRHFAGALTREKPQRDALHHDLPQKSRSASTLRTCIPLTEMSYHVLEITTYNSPASALKMRSDSASSEQHHVHQRRRGRRGEPGKAQRRR